MFRLAPQPGEWLDRARRGSFEFEGERIEFFAGDTYATALAANGRMTLARSFKYHRRRGLFSAANHDANDLFEIDGRPNQRGDVLLARDGARVAACNTVGGVERDRGARLEKLARFLPVGFYYKTFISHRAVPVLRARDPPRLRPRSHRSHVARDAGATSLSALRRCGGRRRSLRNDGGAGRRSRGRRARGAGRRIAPGRRHRRSWALRRRRTRCAGRVSPAAYRDVAHRSARRPLRLRPLRGWPARDRAGERAGRRPRTASRGANRARHRRDRAAGGVPQQRSSRRAARLGGAAAAASAWHRAAGVASPS